MPRIVILMYHIIDEARSDKEEKYCCLPSRFYQQMEYLGSSEYDLINLNDISDVLSGKRPLLRDSVAVTFDDGFDDFFYNALPVLNRFKVPATLFMVAGRIGGYNDWMTKNGSPRRKLLSKEQLLKIIENGVVIGGHTVTHPKLDSISNARLKLDEEITGSKLQLEELLGLPVSHFAYPYGLFDDDTLTCISGSGYQTACSTRSGFNREDIDPYLLRRIEVYGKDRLWHFKQKLKFGTNDMDILFPLSYYLSRLKEKFLP